MAQTSVKVEFSLCEPMLRTKANQLLFTILNNLEINEDFDLKSISYAIQKITKMVYKIVIHFKKSEIADKFFQHIEETQQNQFKDIIKNIVENNDDDYFSSENRSTLSESICVLSPEESFDVTTNQPLFMETSYYDTEFRKSQFDINFRNNFQYEHSSSRSSVVNQSIYQEPTEQQQQQQNQQNDAPIKFDDYTVEFYSSKPIEPNDLEIILLFLENSKQSGGGDSSDYKLDPSKHLLTIKYENSNAKSRVIDKKILTFQQYKLIASEPFDENTFRLDEKTIVLKNVSEKMNVDAVQLFAENLVVNDNEANDVEFVQASLFFKGVFFVSFKMKYNHEKILKRLNRKDTIFNRKISILKAYATRSILVKKVDKNGQPLVEEYVELYFTNKKRCGVDTYLSMRERHPFWLITFDNQQSIETILSQKHLISQQELLLERLVNFEILQEGMKMTDLTSSNLEMIESTTINEQNLNTALEISLNETVKNTPNSTLANNSLNQSIYTEQPASSDKINEQVSLLRPVINLTLNDRPNMKVLFLFDSNYLKQFTNDLLDRDAAAIISTKSDSDEKQIRIECLLQNTSNQPSAHQEWHTKINEYVSKFFEQFETCLVQINGIEEILKRVTYDVMRVECTIIDANCVELCGYKELVESLAARIYAEREKQTESDNEIIEETRADLKLFQIRVLFVNKFIKRMRDKHSNLVLKIDARSSIISMKGTRAQIKDANESLNSIVKSIKTLKYPADDLMIKLIENKEMDIVTWLKDQDILCTLEPDTAQNVILIHSTDEEQLKRCKAAFVKEISTNEVDISLLSDIDNEQELEDFLLGFESESGVVVLNSETSIRICGFNSKVNEIYTKCIERM